MNRRDFMKGVAATGLALRFGPRAFAGQAASMRPLPTLAAVEGESPAAITREAIAVLGGMGKFVAKGDKVVIKPNIGWDRTPEMAACTNPDVVRTLVELVLDAGAKKAIIIDNTTNQAKRCYVRSGIQEAVKQAGGEMLFVDDYRVKKMALKGEWIKEWEILLDVVESDKIINVPIAKHHSLCRLTLGAKNWLGATGGARNQFHQSLDKAVVDLAAFFKPQLTVLDAYRILVRNGPQGGRSRTPSSGRRSSPARTPWPWTPWGPRSSRSSPASCPISPWPGTGDWASSTWGRCALKKGRSRKYRSLERLRMASQAVFFGLFLYLFMGAHYTGQDYIGSTVQRFFHFDPLLALDHHRFRAPRLRLLRLRSRHGRRDRPLRPRLLRLGLPPRGRPPGLVVRLQADEVPQAAARGQGQPGPEILHLRRRSRRRAFRRSTSPATSIPCPS